MQVKTQLEDLQNYLTDASNMPGGHAEKLFVPETEDEIAEILREANERRIPVTISGARTGTGRGAFLSSGPNRVELPDRRDGGDERFGGEKLQIRGDARLCSGAEGRLAGRRTHQADTRYGGDLRR